jgi:hypothetical protein
MAQASSVSPVWFKGAKLALVMATLAFGVGLAGCHGSDDGDHGSTAGGVTTGGTELLPNTGTIAPTEVRMTWFGIANWTFRIGDLNILMDGYMSRIPQDYFSGGGGGLAYTKAAWPIDREAVDKVYGVLRAGPGAPVNLLITGHSHFDHSFDTPYWAQITKAPIVGSRTTCFQTQALGVPPTQCTTVYGGETIALNKYVTMRVVRWNHSGSHELNPEQHDPVELSNVPTPDDGKLRGGVAEDFPNGGGNRGYLFTVKTASNRELTFFVTNSGAPQDLDTDNITDGINYGKPLDSLKTAMANAGLRSVDVWIGAGGQPVASLTLPVLNARAYVPNHLGSFFSPFEKGNTAPFNDTAFADYLASNNVTLFTPNQYFDAWVLDANGFRQVDNVAMKRVYGF